MRKAFRAESNAGLQNGMWPSDFLGDDSIPCSAGRAQEPDGMAASNAKGSFKPALLVVDMQEDFCPPVRELALNCFELIPTTH